MLLAFGLQLPAVPPPSPPAGQPVPPPVTRPAAALPTTWSAIWSHDITETAELRLALSRDFVFVAGPDTALEARAAATGEIAWQHAITSWQALSAGTTTVLGVSGDHAYALDAATGRTRWVTQTTGPNTRLVLDGRHLLMVSDNDLLLRDIDTGTPIWRAGLTAPPAAPAALGTDVVAVAQRNGDVLVLERSTGAARWRTKLSSVARTMSAVSPLVYAGLVNGTFCALNDRNGSERWCFALRVPAVGAPVVDGDQVRVALLDNSLRSFNRLNGSMGQPASLGHRPASGPWLTDTAVIVGLTTGEFLVLDRTSGRALPRLTVPDTTSTQLLEAAAISGDGQTVASVTVTPGGQRRLSAYRPRPAQPLPIVRTLPRFPTVTLQAPRASGPVTPASRAPVPRPFPVAP